MAAEWPMKDFQIHSMWCTPNRIVATGSENARYVFDVGNKQNRTADSSDDDVASSEEGQLGWSVAGVKNLESSDREHKYQLLLASSMKGSEVAWTAELLQIDSHQKVSQRVLLYKRQDTEELGD